MNLEDSIVSGPQVQTAVKEVDGRWGKIRRRMLWPHLKEEMPELKLLTPDVTRAFLTAVNSGAISSRQPDRADDPLFVKDLTAERYLSYCALCIRAFWPREGRPTPREIYRGWADGRHGGLLDLAPQSAVAFRSWLISSECSGSHPFEFFRDRMLLWVHHGPTNRQVWLRLLNFDRFVSAELIVAALALHSTGVTVCAQDVQNHTLLAEGEDFVGIVDDHVWEIGSPKWPADAGILNTACQSFGVSDLAPFPGLLDRVEWLPGSRVPVKVS